MELDLGGGDLWGSELEEKIIVVRALDADENSSRLQSEIPNFEKSVVWPARVRSHFSVIVTEVPWIFQSGCESKTHSIILP
jgi:hypothetical protein